MMLRYLMMRCCYQNVRVMRYEEVELLTIKKLCLYTTYIINRFFHLDVSRKRQMFDVCERLIFNFEGSSNIDACENLPRIIITLIVNI